MNKIITTAAALAVLSLGLVACQGKSTTLPVLGSGLATPLPNPVAPAGAYTQIELLARPAIKEALESFNNHKVTNKVEPYDTVADPLFGEIKATVNLVRPPKMTATGPADFGTTLQSILYPNEIAADLSNTADKASYLGVETGGATGGKFGGRDIADDVVNIDLGAVFGSTLVALKVQPEDNQENNCLSQQSADQKLQRPSQANTGTFPYLSPPH